MHVGTLPRWTWRRGEKILIERRLGRQDAASDRAAPANWSALSHDGAVVSWQDRAARARRALGALSLSAPGRVLRRLRHVRRDARRAGELHDWRHGPRSRDACRQWAAGRAPRAERRARLRVDGVGPVADEARGHRRRERHGDVPAELSRGGRARAPRDALLLAPLRRALREVPVRSAHARAPAHARRGSGRHGVPDAHHDGRAVVRAAGRVSDRRDRGARARARMVLRPRGDQRVRTWPFLDEGLNSYADHLAMFGYKGAGSGSVALGLQVGISEMHAVAGNFAEHDAPIAQPAASFERGMDVQRKLVYAGARRRSSRRCGGRTERSCW